jgi:hypothetical protein
MQHVRSYEEDLVALIQEFRERLESEAFRFRELERALAAVPSQASATLAAIQLRAHRLSGTADSFGELEIGAAAGVVEEAVTDIVKSGASEREASLAVLRQSLRELCALLTKSSAPTPGRSP